MQKVKNTIPVYDICSLSGANHPHEEIIAEPFAAYLQVHQNLSLPHRHTFYHIVLFTEGSGHHTIDFEQFPVVPGQVYFMVPGQVHSWSFKGKVDGYVINFSESLYLTFLTDQQYLEQFRFLRGTAKDSVIKLQKDAMATVKDAMINIVNEVKIRQPLSTDMIVLYLTQLLITVSRQLGEHTDNAPQQSRLLLHNFRKMVDKYYAQKRLPKDYAALLYITPNHLNALCNDLLGIPAGELIRDRILLEVKRLLVNAELSIAEIAYQLSFTDNSHLTRFFKKHTNITPEEFRKNAIGKL